MTNGQWAIMRRSLVTSVLVGAEHIFLHGREDGNQGEDDAFAAPDARECAHGSDPTSDLPDESLDPVCCSNDVPLVLRELEVARAGLEVTEEHPHGLLSAGLPFLPKAPGPPFQLTERLGVANPGGIARQFLVVLPGLMRSFTFLRVCGRRAAESEYEDKRLPPQP